MKTYPTIRKTSKGVVVIESREAVYKFKPQEIKSVKAQPTSPYFAEMLFIDIETKGEVFHWSINVGSQNSLEYKEILENWINSGETQ